MVFHEFLDWFERAAPLQQMQAIRNLVDCHFRHSGRMETHCLLNDPQDAEAILTMVLDSPNKELRKTLAATIAPLETAPDAVILGLANDEDEIAALVFAQSPLVLEAELLARLASCPSVVEIAIATRTQLGSAVLQCLADTGSEEACLALAGNPLVDVPGPILLKILARFGPTDRLREALTKTGRLSDQSTLAEAIGDETRKKLPFFSAAAAGSGEQALQEQTILALIHGCSEDEISQAIEDLIADGKITTTLMLRALVQSELEFLIHAYAHLSRLPLKRIFSLLGTSRVLSYPALHQKSALPASTKTIFAIGLDVQAEAMGLGWVDHPDQDSLICQEMLRRYTATQPDQADEVLIFLRALKVELARRKTRARIMTGVGPTKHLVAPPLLLTGPASDTPAEATDTPTEVRSSVSVESHTAPSVDVQTTLEQELRVLQDQAEQLANLSIRDEVSPADDILDLSSLDIITSGDNAQPNPEQTKLGDDAAHRITSSAKPEEVASQSELSVAFEAELALDLDAALKDDRHPQPDTSVVSLNALDAMAAELEAEVREHEKLRQKSKKSAA